MKGVVVFIKELGDGTVRLTFNDVEASSDAHDTDWKHGAPFTSNSYNSHSFDGLSLSKDQFAQIGENLVIRLLALSGRLK